MTTYKQYLISNQEHFYHIMVSHSTATVCQPPLTTDILNQLTAPSLSLEELEAATNNLISSIIGDTDND